LNNRGTEGTFRKGKGKELNAENRTMVGGCGKRGVREKPARRILPDERGKDSPRKRQDVEITSIRENGQ